MLTNPANEPCPAGAHDVPGTSKAASSSAPSVLGMGGGWWASAGAERAKGRERKKPPNEWKRSLEIINSGSTTRGQRCSSASGAVEGPCCGGGSQPRAAAAPLPLAQPAPGCAVLGTPPLHPQGLRGGPASLLQRQPGRS